MRLNLGLLKRPIAAAGSSSSVNIGDGGRFIIWAEENSALSTSIEGGYQWSFGNGAVGAGNEVSLPFNSELVGMTLDKRNTAGSAEVAVLKNGVQIASIEIADGETNALVNLDTAVAYEAGDRLQFRTISASGFTTSNTCIMGAAFKTTGLANNQVTNNTMINGALEYYYVRTPRVSESPQPLSVNPEGSFIDLRSNSVEIDESDNITRDRNELIFKPGKKYLVNVSWGKIPDNIGVQLVKIDSDANYLDSVLVRRLVGRLDSNYTLIDTTDETQDTIWFLSAYALSNTQIFNVEMEFSIFIQVYNDNTGTALANQAS